MSIPRSSLACRARYCARGLLAGLAAWTTQENNSPPLIYTSRVGWNLSARAIPAWRGREGKKKSKTWLEYIFLCGGNPPLSLILGIRFFFNFSYGFTCFRWCSRLPTAVTIIFRLPGSSIVKMGTGGISPRPALPGVLYSAHKRGSGVGGL